VVVIGAGLSGVSLAIHLLRSGGSNIRVTLVDPSASFGRGVAYDTPDPAHILNVPAGRMSLFPDQPEDFVQYALSRGVPAHGHSLLSRRLYGDYLQARLAQAVEGSKVRLRISREEAVRVTRTATGFSVRLVSGQELPAEDVVLATGNAPAAIPTGLRGIFGDPRFVRSPYEANALKRVNAGDRVLIVGMGLTALDTASSLLRQHHAGPVVAISRHGKWPESHLADAHWTGPRFELDLENAPHTADGLATWLESEVSRAAEQFIPWQAVLGAVRPFVATLWAGLPNTERAVFLRDHRHRWDRFRHRAPLALLAEIRRQRDLGWISWRPGQVVGATTRADGLLVAIQTGDHIRSQVFDHVLLCTGPVSDLRQNESELWKNLIADQLVEPDELGLGLESDPDHRVDAGGRGALWALGGLLRPRHFESTSASELTSQAHELAIRLLRRATEERHPPEEGTERAGNVMP
jgi:uncharacterized NAD(P)/FAD-binding protein YdhS